MRHQDQEFFDRLQPTQDEIDQASRLVRHGTLTPAPAVDADSLIDAVTTYASFAQAFGICSSKNSEFSRAYRQANTDRDAARDAAFTAIRAALRPAAGPPEGQGERAAEQLREIIERIDAFGADITGAYPSIHPYETGWSTILAGLITDLEELAAALAAGAGSEGERGNE